MNKLEKYFEKYRNNTIGYNKEYTSPYGKQKILYADWVASGRLYKPIEDKITNNFGPFVANTHTETSEVGTLMTNSYNYAKKIIKEHVNADKDDVLINTGFGMTSAINKLQRIIGLKYCGRKRHANCVQEKPVVFVTHMEHHSNHTSWLTTIADVVLIEPDKDLLISLQNLETELVKYKDRKIKIGAFTAASNVTGIIPPYYKMAKLMHKYNGLCFVDFAMAAPYININMHPADPEERLDAITFSPHKFLGGPGSAGVLIFNKKLYKREIPDNPGGGTVDWTNAWGEFKFVDDIELREDGGTPGFLQTIRTALSIQLKNEMGVENMQQREEELLKIVFSEFAKIEGINILAPNQKHRLGAISFYHNKIHFNLLVKLLSDKYGIQVRGGCACAGTYGHYLLNVDYDKSQNITKKINKGDLSEKPGWVRLSVHPIMTDRDIYYISKSLKEIIDNIDKYLNDYKYIPNTNEFVFKENYIKIDHKQWFNL